MLFRIAIGLLVLSNLTNCSKDDIFKPYSILNLRIEGYEEDLRWESVAGTWNKSTGKITLDASSYFFDHCTIYLLNIIDTGFVPNIDVTNFYYTDGLDFLPDTLTSGYIRITYFDTSIVSGEFRVSLGDDFNGVENKAVFGGFTINQ
ncbi:MAG: hypothetical protein LCH51_15605 [Bacteroidetes bacterium]|nr:hypothetical protein [Bacteroidota bacterium]